MRSLAFNLEFSAEELERKAAARDGGPLKPIHPPQMIFHANRIFFLTLFGETFRSEGFTVEIFYEQYR